MLNKKLILTLSFLSCISLVGCNKADADQEVHKCRLFEVEANDSTCSQEGNVYHDICIYCNTRYLNGQKVTEEDIKISIDQNNHKHIKSVSEIPGGCIENGTKAHQECEDCGVFFINNQKVTASDLVLPHRGGHEFLTDSMCKNCDSYKVGEQVFDTTNKLKFVSNAINKAHTHTAKDAVIKSAFENRMTFATQGQSILKVSNLNDSWRITQSLTSAPSNTFTRFAVGNEKGEAYVGKILLGFDIVPHQTASMARFGARIVDEAGEDVYKQTQSKLFGSDVNEESKKNRSLTVGKKYRFVYELETTDVKQLIQIWTCSDTKVVDVSITNLYVILVDGGTASVPSSQNLLFQEI